eukprot:g9160.t1
MEPAREGREKCRYDGDTRLVAGCLPITPDGRLVLIGSVKHTDWILPKGGWDTDETAAEAAVREAYEEAGGVTSGLQFQATMPCQRPDQCGPGLARDSQHPRQQESGGDVRPAGDGSAG